MIRVKKLETPEKEVERFLRSDIIRNAPLLYDLTAGFNYCDWHVAYINNIVKGTLTFFKKTSILTRGLPEVVEEILDKVNYKKAFFIIPKEHEKLVKERYNLSDVGGFELMYTTRQRFKPTYIEQVEELNIKNLDEVDFFLKKHGVKAWSPEQLNLWPFYCIRKNLKIVSIAGTLAVYKKTPGAALIGNVYTKKEHRRRGYASAVSSALTSKLLEHLKYVTLWVREENAVAVSLYEKLGYQKSEIFIIGSGMSGS